MWIGGADCTGPCWLHSVMCVHPLPLAGAEKVMAAVAVQLAGWWARCGHTNMCSGDQVAVLLEQVQRVVA